MTPADSGRTAIPAVGPMKRLLVASQGPADRVSMPAAKLSANRMDFAVVVSSSDISFTEEGSAASDLKRLLVASQGPADRVSMPAAKLSANRMDFAVVVSSSDISFTEEGSAA